MPMSVLTKKWQTTIPKEIRRFLGLQPRDRLLYLVEGDKVTLKPLKGDILELRGTVYTDEKPLDFGALRKATKRKVAKRIVEGSQ